jgi:hypothetical protein
MPFKSKAQQRFLFATEPKVAEKFAQDTPKGAYANLPENVKPKKKGGMKSMLSALQRMGE